MIRKSNSTPYFSRACNVSYIVDYNYIAWMNLVNNLFNIKQLRIVIQKSYFKIKLLLIYGVKQFVKEAYIKALVGDKISE